MSVCCEGEKENVLGMVFNLICWAEVEIISPPGIHGYGSVELAFIVFICKLKLFEDFLSFYIFVAHLLFWFYKKDFVIYAIVLIKA